MAVLFSACGIASSLTLEKARMPSIWRRTLRSCRSQPPVRVTAEFLFLDPSGLQISTIDAVGSGSPGPYPTYSQHQTPTTTSAYPRSPSIAKDHQKGVIPQITDDP